MEEREWKIFHNGLDIYQIERCLARCCLIFLKNILFIRIMNHDMTNVLEC